MRFARIFVTSMASVSRQTMSQPHTLRVATRLRNEICQAPAPNCELVSAALELMIARRPVPYPAARREQIRALIDAQGWTDAILAIADVDRSRVIRYIVHEDGEWHCRIGSHLAVPHWLDDNAEFSHPVLALAILGALVETLRWVPAAAGSSPASASRRPTADTEAIPAVSCDNYL
jgi:hypothetical protein